MNPWINYHHLYYFKTIAEEGSVSKAAEKLHLGQPTLSSQLKQLEENLGVELFYRQNRRLVLSEAGQLALDYSRSIFQLGSDMYEALNDRLIPHNHHLHIGALDSVPKQIILQLVEKAYKLEDCQITLSEGRPEELLRELEAHRIDLVVSNFLPSGPNAKGFQHKLISKKPISFYAAPKYKSLRKGFPGSISGQPMIVPSYDSKIRDDLDHWASLNEIRFNVICESQDISMKKLMAVSGLGIIPTASHTVQKQVLKGELIQIGTTKNLSEELYLISVKRKIPNPVAVELLKKFKI